MELDPILLLKIAIFVSWIELPFWGIILMSMKKNKSKNKAINPKGIRIRKTVVIMKKITAVSIIILSGIIVVEYFLNPEINLIKSICLTGILIPLHIFLNIFGKIVIEMNNKGSI